MLVPIHLLLISSSILRGAATDMDARDLAAWAASVVAVVAIARDANCPAAGPLPLR